jgi:hypothetical protein
LQAVESNVGRLAVIGSAGENLADRVVRDPDQLKSYGTVVRSRMNRAS